MSTNTKNTFPTLEEAKKHISKYVRPVGQNLILINNMSPMVTETGIQVQPPQHKILQEKDNANGMMVAWSPFNKEDLDTRLDAILEGEVVVLTPEIRPLHTSVVRTEELVEGLKLPELVEKKDFMNKGYIILVVRPHEVAAVLSQD